jgi:hypothetical protein
MAENGVSCWNMRRYRLVGGELLQLHGFKSQNIFCFKNISLNVKYSIQYDPGLKTYFKTAYDLNL